MLKPEDIKYIHPITVATTQDQECELQFDEAIRRAAETGEWPAIVSSYRDGMHLDTVDRVAKLYRDAGWLVETRLERGPYARHVGIRAVISKPEKP